MKIEKSLFVYLSIGFIIFTPIGTLSHEFGHFLMAKFFSLKAEINYASTFYYPVNSIKPITSIQEIAISIAGPIQTILTGTIGFMILWNNRTEYINSIFLNFKQWVLVYVSLFWLRQPVNFAVYCLKYMIFPNYESNGDEIEIAEYLGLPNYSISLLTAFIGFSILYLVVFKILPIHLRLTFISSLLAGGMAGYVIWLHWLGPIIMP